MIFLIYLNLLIGFAMILGGFMFGALVSSWFLLIIPIGFVVTFVGACYYDEVVKHDKQRKICEGYCSF